MFLCGAGIGFFTGDPLRLVEDTQILQPEFFPCVPRVLNRLAMGIQAAAATPGAKGQFRSLSLCLIFLLTCVRRSLKKSLGSEEA